MKKLIVAGLVVALVAAALGPASAGKKGKKKKGPKRWVSEEVDLAMGHPVTLIAGAGLVRTPFEAQCAIPPTQGSDGYVFEVPAEYQKIAATVLSFGLSGDYDLDLFIYDESCALRGQFDSETADEVGFIGPGAAYILVANYRPSPTSVRLEMEPTKI